MNLLFIVGILCLIIVVKGVRIVPQQDAWVIERLGRFEQVLQPGLNLLIPFIQQVAYKHTLKEQAIDIQAQTAISKDNVALSIDGILYVKIIDPKAASYGVSDPLFAIAQLAQTTMRSEIGKMDLDKTFEEREALNIAIVEAINEASTNWGIQCMRYEIKDIHPPKSILQSMELQVAAERQKRAQILESEGSRQAKINNAEAEKQEIVLASEAALLDQVNRAKGEAQAIEMVATATANGINHVASALKETAGKDAAALKIAEQYVEAFASLAKTGNTILLPAGLNDPSAMVASAMGIYKNLSGNDNSKKSTKKDLHPWD